MGPRYANRSAGARPKVQLLGDGHEVAQLAQLHPASLVQCESRPINREQTGRSGRGWVGLTMRLQRASERARKQRAREASTMDQTTSDSQRVGDHHGLPLRAIGASLVSAYRKLGYAVVANSPHHHRERRHDGC